MYFVTPDETTGTPAAVPAAVASFKSLNHALAFARKHAMDYHYGLTVVDDDGEAVDAD